MHIMIFRHSRTSQKYHWKIISTKTIYLPLGVPSLFITLNYMYAMERLSLEGCGAASTLETKSGADMGSVHQTRLISSITKTPRSLSTSWPCYYHYKKYCCRKIKRIGFWHKPLTNTKNVKNDKNCVRRCMACTSLTICTTFVYCICNDMGNILETTCKSFKTF